MSRFRSLASCLLCAALCGANISARSGDPVPASGGDTRPDTPATLRRSGSPEYPAVLRKSGNRGDVTVRTRISQDGSLQAIIVTDSDHPAFERAVVDWLLRQNFLPATRAGVPVDSWASQKFTFNFGFRGVEPFSAPSLPSPQLPEYLRYETPPKIRYVAPVVYPYQMLQSDKSGSARVSILVGPDGKPRKVEVLEASEPDFGGAMKASLEAWTFEPARKNGKPSWALFVKEQQFDEAGRDVQIGGGAQHLVRLVAENAPELLQIKDLDATPHARYQPLPVYPPDLKAGKITGSARIEFIIDKAGAAQLPRIVSATQPDFGWAAATAIARWRFDPPLRNGAPVTVRTQIPLEFKLEDAEPDAYGPAGETAPR
jgi:TonB family protein